MSTSLREIANNTALSKDEKVDLMAKRIYRFAKKGVVLTCLSEAEMTALRDKQEADRQADIDRKLKLKAELKAKDIQWATELLRKEGYKI
jgi:hypothetical protein